MKIKMHLESAFYMAFMYIVEIAFCDLHVDKMDTAAMLTQMEARIEAKMEAKMEARLKQFELRENAMENELNDVRTRLTQFQRTEKTMQESIDHLRKDNVQLQREIKDSRSYGVEERMTKHFNALGLAQNRRQLLQETTTAFTAYLDHVVKNIGSNQAIIYNTMLLNDNNAYSNHSGIFRSPVAGLYLFSWSVVARDMPGTHHPYDVWSHLVVNGVKKLSAVAESQVEMDDNQGSNTAVVRLSAGDEVWTVHSGSNEVYGGPEEIPGSILGAGINDHRGNVIEDNFCGRCPSTAESSENVPAACSINRECTC